MSLRTRRIAVITQLPLLVLVICWAACTKSENSSSKVFQSPDEAGDALLQAARSGDQNALVMVLGPESKELISSGDPTEDKTIVDAFVGAYGEMHRWHKMTDGSQILLVGVDNFPFPIPLRKNAGGRWYFDTASGKDEILARRIGRNELAVISVCGALVDAQAEYFSRHRDDGGTNQYALKFISDTGLKNGLYWESPDGQARSPLGPLVAFATKEGYSVKPNSHTPFHGYNFRMLTRQGSHAPGGAKDYVVDGKMVGGFAFVAYPTAYGDSGVMTFMINQDGVLLQKDLGKTTTETATAMTEFDPDSTWTVVGEQ
jgi:hypothetical protein